MIRRILSIFKKEKAEKEEPQFMAVPENDEAFQKAVHDARSTINEFKQALENLPENVYACVKFFIPENPEGSEGANIWLMSPFFESGYCCAQPFELPEEFSWTEVGQWLKFPEEEILDWYLLSEAGELRGGYSLRVQRMFTPNEKQEEFDERIGVKKYL